MVGLGLRYRIHTVVVSTLCGGSGATVYRIHTVVVSTLCGGSGAM